ncbi:MAG: hypothetical protein II529_04055, partial [Erysipelotrichaceae bacterium]|nr:hypothetical protein [Erysipelotrichaceae bacterium]
MYGNCDHSLKAEFAYCGEEILSFDLHEKKQGPHGLIAGSTGSGKSELIISMLLSLCIRYSPEYLNIVLIDYKGGGIRESLSYEGKCVPHIVASVSNLENNRFERLILALKQECIRRQRRFSELSTASGLSIMDIDDFRSCSRDQKMPHLLIVVDEFAELKKENPHLIRELISVSRIGRSLGLHLILATQRPSGNIDDEIWSNSRFKLSLKVFEEKDSLDVLKTKDAAYLEGAGSFLLRVDDSLIKARSIYAKYDMHDRDPYEVDILDQTLSPVRSVYRQNQGTLSQAAAFCSMILDHCQKNGIVPKKIDFEAPEPCSRKQLTAGACLVFGEVDDYLNGRKDLLAYGFRENILICSRRSNEINGIMNTLNEFRRQSVLITHRPLEGNYICDCLHYEQKEDIVFLFEKLMRSDCEITVVIRDVQALLSCDDNYVEMLCRFLRRSDIRSNLICLSRDPRISYRLLGMFSGRILIDSRGSEDLNSFFSCGSRYKGNSYFLKEEPVTFVPVKTEEYQKGRRMIGHFIDRIPEKIFPKRDESGSLLGYLERERSPLFCKDRVLICSY